MNNGTTSKDGRTGVSAGEGRLVVGMPAGSLADPKRGGNLVALLEGAGFKTSGYESGGPTSFPTCAFLYGWDGRPQEFGSQLGVGELDIAIAGDDWIRERILELRYEYEKEIELEKVLSLQRGGVRIVGIAPGDTAQQTAAAVLTAFAADPQKRILTVASEMPYLALDWVRLLLKKAGLDGRFPDYAVQKYRTPPKVSSGVVVYETWGKTESKIMNGGVDLGLEITQSGSAIRNYGLKIVDEIMTSETGIWIRPAVREEPRKLEILRMFLLNLYGCINAEGKVLVLFNVAKENAAAIEGYLEENNLFADEPTRNVGREYTEYSVQVDVADPTAPIARIRYELATLGAKSIDTIPLSSSIPHLDVLPI